MQLSTLIKIMMLTTSDRDMEVLAAIRTANAMLAEHDTSWEELLNFKDTSLKFQMKHRGPEVECMLKRLEDTLRPGSAYRHFFEPVCASFKAKGYLTGTQFKEIKRAYEQSLPKQP